MKKHTGSLSTPVKIEIETWPGVYTRLDHDGHTQRHSIDTFRDLVRTLPQKNRTILNTLNVISRG